LYCIEHIGNEIIFCREDLDTFECQYWHWDYDDNGKIRGWWGK
jgi:hypothetical protein